MFIVTKVDRDAKTISVIDTQDGVTEVHSMRDIFSIYKKVGVDIFGVDYNQSVVKAILNSEIKFNDETISFFDCLDFTHISDDSSLDLTLEVTELASGKSGLFSICTHVDYLNMVRVYIGSDSGCDDINIPIKDFVNKFSITSIYCQATSPITYFSSVSELRKFLAGYKK